MEQEPHGMPFRRAHSASAVHQAPLMIHVYDPQTGREEILDLTAVAFSIFSNFINTRSTRYLYMHGRCSRLILFSEMLFLGGGCRAAAGLSALTVFLFPFFFGRRSVK